jgi:hypothetical protein
VKIVEESKTSSSVWIKKQHAWHGDFAWQTGYGELSVIPMRFKAVREYIRQQAEHQRQEDFQTVGRPICAGLNLNSIGFQLCRPKGRTEFLGTYTRPCRPGYNIMGIGFPSLCNLELPTD